MCQVTGVIAKSELTNVGFEYALLPLALDERKSGIKTVLFKAVRFVQESL